MFLRYSDSKREAAAPGSTPRVYSNRTLSENPNPNFAVELFIKVCKRMVNHCFNLCSIFHWTATALLLMTMSIVCSATAAAHMRSNGSDAWERTRSRNLRSCDTCISISFTLFSDAICDMALGMDMPLRRLEEAYASNDLLSRGISLSQIAFIAFDWVAQMDAETKSLWRD
ncbi:hypothetical protein BaOVIS_027060 [Babesia ovis]|uniref:Uncharacterized protein n=1 Tax=Babesia ovis TaxID=5869 RepID=A0A9W5WWE0_BABOV|nr:hypothetical protein BaOVIS_027060 [Babesia ovis]